jgi:hypothetical protein
VKNRRPNFRFGRNSTFPQETKRRSGGAPGRDLSRACGKIFLPQKIFPVAARAVPVRRRTLLLRS